MLLLFAPCTELISVRMNKVFPILMRQTPRGQSNHRSIFHFALSLNRDQLILPETQRAARAFRTPGFTKTHNCEHTRPQNRTLHEIYANDSDWRCAASPGRQEQWRQDVYSITKSNIIYYFLLLLCAGDEKIHLESKARQISWLVLCAYPKSEHTFCKTNN